MTRQIFLAVAFLLAAHGAPNLAGAETISFDELAPGDVVFNQYQNLGVTFQANVFLGPSGSSSRSEWATNSKILVVPVAPVDPKKLDFGELGSPALVTGNILHSFNDWLNEDGDPNWSITFAQPITSISVDFAGVTVFADTKLFIYTNGGLAEIVTALPTGAKIGQLTLKSTVPRITRVVIALGTYDDWVGVDNITFTR